MPKRKLRSAASVTPYHHGDLRHTLIETALTMLTEEGAWNFTLREVARRAGVSHTAPYNHFADKSALLAEVAALGFDALRERMDAAAARQSRSARQVLQGIAGAYVRFAVEHPAHYRLMFGSDLAEKEQHPTLQKAADATFGVLTSALERGQAAGEIRRGAVREQALAAWALVHGIATLLIDKRLAFLGVPIAEAERYARGAAASLCEGLDSRRT